MIPDSNNSASAVSQARERFVYIRLNFVPITWADESFVELFCSSLLLRATPVLNKVEKNKL
jgi:hypothetical protein